MTKSEILAAIKTLRDKINNKADCGPGAEGWEGGVTEALDRAGDLIEFPKDRAL